MVVLGASLAGPLDPDAAISIRGLVKRYGDPGIFMPYIIGENGRPMRKEGSIIEPVPRRRVGNSSGR